MEREIVIRAKDLVKKFGDFVANDHLNFEVYKGEIFGFLGANGAGKTTAMRILCGLSAPTSGEISVGGYDVYHETEKIKRNIGYMSQKFSLYEDLTVFENIRFYAGIYGLTDEQIKEKSEALMQELGLVDKKKALIRSLPLGWEDLPAMRQGIRDTPVTGRSVEHGALEQTSPGDLVLNLGPDQQTQFHRREGEHQDHLRVPDHRVCPEAETKPILL